ncbi:MAG: hypothetical protein IH851_05895 [Armatimonadetes bacterium]|nr:hypothetical protein [Armatimonadota bacterium]
MELHPSVSETFERLEREAPGVPLLALGQTVLWDEPLKAALPVLAEQAGRKVSLVAGVHDTDYFAKLPGGLAAGARFVALPHNDGSTRGFWSAAGEFSALFGSETPVTREDFVRAGVSLDRIARGNPTVTNEATEAWGWRGIALNDARPRVTGEIAVSEVFECLQDTFRWALDMTVDCLCEPEQRAEGERAAERLQALLRDVRETCKGQTLAEYYECLLPELHRLLTGDGRSTTFVRTSKLLRFTRETASLPRFAFVDLFLNPKTAAAARDAYNAAVAASETYTLDRFGVGAIPFDLVIPGEGRGTVRLTKKALVVMTPNPKFVSLETPVESVQDLADVVEEAFGTCALVGKALTLISMLSAEYVFAFHETASPYVSLTRRMHNILRKSGIKVNAYPILRVAHETWDSLDATDRWFSLPEPFRRPFGAEHLSGHSLAKSWRCVAGEEMENLRVLGAARSPSALIHTLHRIKGGRWETLAAEYESVGQTVRPIQAEVKRVRKNLAGVYDRLRGVKREWQETERAQGEHFRSRIFGRTPAAKDVSKREEFAAKIVALRDERRQMRARLRELWAKQERTAGIAERREARGRRREIEREAELARLRVVREGVIVTRGLARANRRPSAWWLAVVSPDGAWFRRMMEKMELRLEPLVGELK